MDTHIGVLDYGEYAKRKPGIDAVDVNEQTDSRVRGGEASY